VEEPIMGPDFDLDGDAFMAKPSPTLRRWQFSVRGLMKLVLALACVFALLSLLLPGGTYCGENARRAQCINNLKQIELALESYHQEYGVLPPAYVADANGRPMHSWRVLLLPFLDQQSLYDHYDFSEPWNGPNNVKLLNSMPYCFACPSRLPYSKSLTCYAAITGPGTMFPGTTPARFADDADGFTIMVADVANVNIPWTSPTDLDIRTMSLQINDPKRPGMSSKHPRGANAFVHGSGSRFLNESMPAQYVRHMTIANDGGMVIESDSY
jgi:hypothetical protein